ncbi:DUF599 domain-containing protein [Quillaja saponaria]|uniref:DUF599 domain-containing protein n=1 Tax=Quillaja saponaria TaxID=32244 RepID=A0AAD7LVM4_QUISA|nr:DUF599 domain-containing protein [Quillaja saponaria]
MMEKKFIDYIVVPSGLFVLVAYHTWLLCRIVKQPTKTVIGLNAINRRFWVQAMMEEVSRNGVLAVQSLRNNIMASTLLASTAIMLSSLIAILMTSGNQTQSAAIFIFGDRSQLCFSIKFFCILVCFLTAFLMNVQSVRYYSHASILINVPIKKMSPNHSYHILTAEDVATIVNKGSYFWSLGLRAFYFSFPLFLWIFGPIPMFLSCFVLVLMLYFLDVTFEVGRAVGIPDDEEHHKDEELGGAN